MKPIYSLTPFSMLDYPDKLSCIVWFCGCNMRCKYCYNHEVVLGDGEYGYDDILKFLKSRVSLLDGVVLSGGEATLASGIYEFAQKIKDLGFLLKLDTNGSNPKVLENLKPLLDFVSLDFKAPKQKYKNICGTDKYDEFLLSLSTLLGSNIEFEVRTTIHSDILSVEDIASMSEILYHRGYRGKYYLQGFVGDNGSFASMGESLSLESEITALQTPLEIIYRGR